jgi:hypothetical protein
MQFNFTLYKNYVDVTINLLKKFNWFKIQYLYARCGISLLISFTH